MPRDPYTLPFMTRDQMNFGPGSTVSLRATFQSSTVAQVYLVGMTRNGTFKFPLVGDGTNSIQQFTFEIPDIPIFCSVTDSDFSFTAGTLYATVALLINGDFVTNLCTGYIDFTHAISWPPLNDTYRGAPIGNVVRTTTTNPAAGGIINHTIPTHEVWKIRGLQVTLVTSAVAGTRTVFMGWADGTGGSRFTIACATQAASLTRNYNASEFSGGNTFAFGTTILVPIPQDCYLTGGGSVSVQIDGGDVGDDFGSATITHDTFLTGV